MSKFLKVLLFISSASLFTVLIIICLTINETMVEVSYAKELANDNKDAVMEVTETDFNMPITKQCVGIVVSEEPEGDAQEEEQIVAEEDVQQYFEYCDDYYYEDSGGVLNPFIGTVNYNGYKETYYSQRVLPGYGLNIPGRHVDENGLIRDEDGYIALAMYYNEELGIDHFGEIHETSLGVGKVYDSGCDDGIIDVYTDWPSY